MLMFYATASTEGNSPFPPPRMLWVTRGSPCRIEDLAILIQGLLPGDIIRVVSNSWAIQPLIEAPCEENSARIVKTSEDCCKTLFGGYHHCYVDVQRVA